MEEDLFPEHNKHDISSYSNFERIMQENIVINGFIDFNKKKLSGEVIITFRVIDPSERRVVLDLKHVKVHSVKGPGSSGKELKFSLYENNPDKDGLGTPLIVLIDWNLKKEERFDLTFSFHTTDKGDSIQWLDQDQTLTKAHPFMFTQGEAILIRSLIPCQDSPSAKATVSANLTVDKPLTALFSGIKVGEEETPDKLQVTHRFEQKIPVPTYLIAIACGELEYAKLSDRCGIYTEVGLKEQAQWEFSNTEDFLKLAEGYLTPYQWGVYNILVLPSAFAYGGMENPCLTFVTNALLAGDKSMTNVIAHEIAHSWTGNLVTNKDWANFWMNEGFTTFMERKLAELMYDEDMAHLEALVGKEELKYAIESVGKEHNFTSLAPDLSNIDPDDAFSVVPYEKGFTFLYFLEQLVGKPNFQHILQTYIKKYQLQSVSFEQYREVFEEECRKIYKSSAEEILQKIDWKLWIESTGYPVKEFDFRKILFMADSKWIDQAKQLADKFLANQADISCKGTFVDWHTNVKLVFLNYINEHLDKVTEEVYSSLRDILQLHNNYNAEVKYTWYQIALHTKHTDAVEYVKKFLATHGRMKYIKPVYEAWGKLQPQEAISFLDEHKKCYHNVALRIVENMMGKYNE